VLKGDIQLLVSAALAIEYEAKCLSPDQMSAAGIKRQKAEEFLDTLIAASIPIDCHFLWRPQLRDPGDEMVLETAINGQAQGLVTFNRRDFMNAPERFGVSLMLPREALVEVAKNSGTWP